MNIGRRLKQSNVLGALPLTGGAEDVEGVLPDAGWGEMKRLRARRLEFAMMDPGSIKFMNSQRRMSLLMEAFEAIRELQGRLETLTGLKTQVPPRKDK